MKSPDIGGRPGTTTIVIEADGVILNVEPVYWSAYGAAAGEIGRPRTDPAVFWRAIRSAAKTGTYLAGARTAQVRPFEQRLSELVESDDAWTAATVADQTNDALRKMRVSAKLVLVSVGRNRQARQKRLDAAGLSDHFFEMYGLPAERSRRVERLTALSGEWGRVLVVASTDELVRSSDAAGLFTVGVSSGACTTRRLEQAGARAVFNDIASLADELASGGHMLMAHGWLPPARTGA
ncbi:MAG: HAD family hydrolase [Phycisphaerales bacterium]|nr:HAD family hydrolase [Phycisphaerales bacterium]